MLGKQKQLQNFSDIKYSGGSTANWAPQFLVCLREQLLSQQLLAIMQQKGVAHEVSNYTWSRSDICPFDFQPSYMASSHENYRINACHLCGRCPLLSVCDPLQIDWGITSYLSSLSTAALFLQKSFFGCPWSWNGKVVILLCPQLTPPTMIRF